MPRRWAAIVGVGLVIVMALPLVRYGSLRPCEIRRQDLRTAFRAAAGRLAGPSSADAMDQAARKLGAALATAIADPVIDEIVAPIGAVEMRALGGQAQGGSGGCARRPGPAAAVGPWTRPPSPSAAAPSS